MYKLLILILFRLSQKRYFFHFLNIVADRFCKTFLYVPLRNIITVGCCVFFRKFPAYRSRWEKNVRIVLQYKDAKVHRFARIAYIHDASMSTGIMCSKWQ